MLQKAQGQNSPVRVQTGGKLYVAGEYAILTPGQTSLIHFIPIKMTARVEGANRTQLSSDMFSYGVGREPDANYALIQASLDTFEAFTGQSLPALSLAITGKLEKDGVKYGIGSSGSVVVLVIKALAKFCQVTLDKDTLFKLACYTLLKQGDNGSMGDLACIVYEDLIAYQSFDRKALAAQIDKQSLAELLAMDWGYEIRVVAPKLPATFLVGWTKQAAISKDMITAAKSRISADFLQESETAVQEAIIALETKDKALLKAGLTRASQALEQLSPAIYVDKLKTLKEATVGLDAIAKSSGAGGGDCGIAYAFDASSRQELLESWQQAGIELLYEENLT